MSLPHNDTKHALRIRFPVRLLIYLTLLFDSRSVSSSVSFSVFFNFFDSSCSVFHSLFHSMCVVLRQLRQLLFFNGFRRFFSSVFSSLLKQGDYTLPFGREKLHRHLIRPSPFLFFFPLLPPPPPHDWIRSSSTSCSSSFPSSVRSSLLDVLVPESFVCRPSDYCLCACGLQPIRLAVLCRRSVLSQNMPRSIVVTVGRNPPPPFPGARGPCCSSVRGWLEASRRPCTSRSVGVPLKFKNSIR